MKNYNHDLIHQLSEVLDSIWRMEEYIQNAKDCPECQKLWLEVKSSFEEIAQKIQQQLIKHIQTGNFE